MPFSRLLAHPLAKVLQSVWFKDRLQWFKGYRFHKAKQFGHTSLKKSSPYLSQTTQQIQVILINVVNVLYNGNREQHQLSLI